MLINIMTGIFVLGVSLFFLAGWLIFIASFHPVILIPITAILVWILAVFGERKIVKYRRGFRVVQILLATLALIYLIVINIGS